MSAIANWMANAENRLVQEVTRLGGQFARVHGEVDDGHHSPSGLGKHGAKQARPRCTTRAMVSGREDRRSPQQ
jgi:hypothetical protein